jgi:hypothetical protein
MAKRVNLMALFEPPPISKEEALGGRVSFWEPPDGFDGKGGGEAPSEFDLDRMVYPHDCGPMEQAEYERMSKRDADKEAYQEEALQRSRQFTITEDALTGTDPGPPSAFGKKGD